MWSIACAWLKPRLAWPVLVGLFVFFDYILTTQLAAGAESCGCFGATIKVSPWLVLAIDSSLLLAMLVTRPWRMRRKGAPFWLLGLTTLIAFVLPWIVIPEAAPAPVQTTANPVDDGNATGADGGGDVAEVPDTRRYILLQPENWIDQMIWDIEELTNDIDPGLLPSEGKLVLWRQGCDHCAEHLREMSQTDDGSLPVLLIQIRDDLNDGRAVDLMPQGPHVTEVQFPAGLEVVVQTPWDLTLEGGIITQALGPEDLEADGE